MITPQDIVAEVLRGQWMPPAEQAAHVVSELTDAGCSIVPNGDVTRRYSAAYRNSDGKVAPVGVDYRKRAWAEEVRDDPNLEVFIAYRDEPEWQEADQ